MEAAHPHPIYSRDATVHIVTGSDKFDTFFQLLDQAGFISHLLEKWKASGKQKSDFKIVIKANIMTASSYEQDSPVYTDPELVERLIQMMRDQGFEQFVVVETQNVFNYSYTKRTVPAVAAMCGYSGNGYDILDLADDTVDFDYGGVLGVHPVGRTWLAADYRISFAKNKSHWQCFYTACLKNVYGCLPLWDKMNHYHGKNIEFFQATILIVDKFPIDFGIVDAWTNGDGLTGHVRDAKPNLTKTFMASDNSYALDWVAGEKMGIYPPDNYVIREAMTRWGTIHITRVGVGDMKPWSHWRNVRPFFVKSLNILEEFYWLGRFMSRAMANKMDPRFPPVKKCQWLFGILQRMTGFFEKLATTKKIKLKGKQQWLNPPIAKQKS